MYRRRWPPLTTLTAQCLAQTGDDLFAEARDLLPGSGRVDAGHVDANVARVGAGIEHRLRDAGGQRVGVGVGEQLVGAPSRGRPLRR